MPSVWLTDYKLDADRKGPANSSFVQTFSQIIHFSFQIQVFSWSSSFLNFACLHCVTFLGVMGGKKENPQLDMIAGGGKRGKRGNEISSEQHFFAPGR